MSYSGKYSGARLYRIHVPGNYNAVFSAMKTEPFFINLAPIWVEEKIDTRILRDENLAYVHSLRHTIKADVYFYSPTSRADAYDLLASLVDTITPFNLPTAGGLGI
jgi:hypothetical protein